MSPGCSIFITGGASLPKFVGNTQVRTKRRVHRAQKLIENIMFVGEKSHIHCFGVVVDLNVKSRRPMS